MKCSVFFKKKKKQRSQEFIQSLSSRSDEFLKEAYINLDSQSQLGIGNVHTIDELLAVDRELYNRGFIHQRDY